MHNKLLILCFICLACLKITVLHGQTITAGAATGTITACAGSASASPNLQQIVVIGAGLSSDIIAAAPANFELSLTSTGNYTNTLVLPSTGSIVYVRSAITAPVGSVSGNVSFSSAGANMAVVQVDANIMPLPTVNTVAGQTVVSGNLTIPVKFTGTAPAYLWSNSNPAIGVGNNGSGDIPSFRAINTGTTPVIAKFTVTPAPAGFIFTSNVNGNSVSMVNTGNNAIEATIPVGSGPVVSLVNPNQREVYISCFYQNEIYVLDALSGSVTAKISVGNYPEYMTTSSDGSTLYVLIKDGSNPNITVINTATHTISAVIPVGPQPQILALSPDGSRLYVATYGNSGSIYIINTVTNKVITYVSATSTPGGMAISPDGSRVYITDRANNSISIINTATNTVMAVIKLGNFPLQPVINTDGSRVYVANMLSNNISVINTTNNTVIATIPTGDYSGGCALSSDGQLLYATNRVSQSVSVISTATNTVIKTIPLNGPGLDNPVISPDGTRLYITDDGSNVIHVINTATNTYITDVQVGKNPMMTNKSISTGNGCTGKPITFTITVTPPVPTVTASGTLNSVNTSYGIPSTSASFIVSGNNLSTGITVTPPPGFEVSTDNVNFTNTIIVGDANTTGPFTIYIRLAAATNAGTYSGNIVLSSDGATNFNVNMPNSNVSPSVINIAGTYNKLYGNVLADFTLYYNTPNSIFNISGLRNGNTFKSVNIAFGSGAAGIDPVGTYAGTVILSDFEGDNGFLPGNYIVNYSPLNLIVQPAPLTIKAEDISKPYGTGLADGTTLTNFTVTGLQNNETIGNVKISYGPGASALSTPGLYTGSIVPSGATGGTFFSENYAITYQAGNIIVNAPPSPAITYTNLPLALRTAYGTPSATTSITVSGTNLTSGVLITSPPAFEISTDNRTFGNTAMLPSDATGGVTAIIYIRLAAINQVGNYSGDLMLNSTGAGSRSVPLSGIVVPAQLTIAAEPAIKTYGATLTGGSGSNLFKATGLQNGETIGSVTLTYGNGAAATDPAGLYTASSIISDATGGNFNRNNYNIIYVAASITVNQALLTITANNISRAFAMPNPVLTITYTGFVNNEDYTYLTTLPIASTDATLTSPIGQYPIVVRGALSPNYLITYVPGILTIYSAPQNIKIPNTFTPNNDGINDFWEIGDLQYYSNCTVEIYNRYGQQVYHSHGYGQAWDGTYNNQQLPVGTYYYIINLNDKAQTKLSGYVVIVK